MHSLKRAVSGGALAGIMIAIGCAVYLACDNKYIGALLFSVALLTICIQGYVLYTGRIGLLLTEHSPSDLVLLFGGLVLNLAAAAGCCALIAYASPALAETAAKLAEAKLAQSFLQTVVRAVFCGILMNVAVGIWKRGRVIGIVFAIPVFILSGFEHSIADAGYLAAAGVPFADWLGYTATVLLGNTIGSVSFAAICCAFEGGKKVERQQ